MSLVAVTDLTLAMMPKETHENIKTELVKAGAPKEVTFKNLMVSTLKTLGSKVAGEAADGLIGSAGDFIKPLFDFGSSIVASLWSNASKDIVRKK